MARPGTVGRPHWDANSPQLLANLARIDVEIRRDAVDRVTPSLDRMCEWHAMMMEGLDAENTDHVGRFRGDPRFKALARNVVIAGALGTPFSNVSAEVLAFESRLLAAVAALDALFPTPDDLDSDGRAAVIEVAAFAHSEWVRIHPFINGNGRTSRIWANLIMQRYGMPPVLVMRPRPSGRGYEDAAAACMNGDSAPLAAYIRKLYDTMVGASPPVRVAPAKQVAPQKPKAKKNRSN